MERPTQMFLVQLDDTLLCTILASLWEMFQILDGFWPLELPIPWMLPYMESPTQMFLVQLDDTLLCTILAALWGMFQIMDGFCPLGILISETALSFSLFFYRDTHWVMMGKIILSRALSS
jgi:hypothetical protein